ncbi:glutamine-hydrolyzing GMP synthase [Nocardia ninae]
MKSARRPVVIIDFGAQYAHLIARRVRELGYYSVVVSHDTAAVEIEQSKPLALILSGGPSSVYAPGAPAIDRKVLELGVPVFGICYGFQLMALLLGGQVAHNGVAEYGRTDIRVKGGALHGGLPTEMPVWMSHRDAVVRAPIGFDVMASSDRTAIAAFESPALRMAGVQYHPEVHHTPHGPEVLRRFLEVVADCAPNWSMGDVAGELIDDVRDKVGDGRAICALSGGVDSAVAAAVVHAAIGDRLSCVLVDNGLLREGEREQVVRDFEGATGAVLTVRNEQKRFLDSLAGISEPELKRKAIGRSFIESFTDAVSEMAADDGFDRHFLVQGTLYSDVIESGGSGNTAANIKSHHNVGGLPEEMRFSLVEPLRQLFKDEVRRLGAELGLPKSIIGRQPFPGPGLAIRIVGEVTQQRLELVRKADAIVREVMAKEPADADVWQFPVVLLAEVRSVGVMGDGRSYGHPLVLRPVTSEDAMTADWTRLPHELIAALSNRLTNELPEVNRVVLDVTSKPPATIEWE